MNLTDRERGRSTPLMVAARVWYLEGVRMLVAAGASVNAVRGFDRMTPLMLAAETGCDAIAEELLRQGADVTARRSRPDTEDALGIARNFGHRGVVAVLQAERVRRWLERGGGSWL